MAQPALWQASPTPKIPKTQSDISDRRFQTMQTMRAALDRKSRRVTCPWTPPAHIRRHPQRQRPSMCHRVLRPAGSGEETNKLRTPAAMRRAPTAPEPPNRSPQTAHRRSLPASNKEVVFPATELRPELV